VAVSLASVPIDRVLYTAPLVTKGAQGMAEFEKRLRFRAVARLQPALPDLQA